MMIHEVIIILLFSINISFGKFVHNKRLINRYLNKRELLSDNSEEEGPLILNVSEKAAYLDRHNYYRSQTALGLQTGYNNELLPKGYDMNKLLWDDGLEELAMYVASKCEWAHSYQSERLSFLQSNNNKSFTLASHRFIGENMFITSRNSKSVRDGAAMVDLWAAQSQYWMPLESSGYCTCRSSCSYCNHWKQIINSDTRYVGCGIYFCPNGALYSPMSSTPVYIGVCNYMVGLISSETVYGKLPGCESDRNYNEVTGLCEPIITTTIQPPTATTTTQTPTTTTITQQPTTTLSPTTTTITQQPTTTLSPTRLYVRTLTGSIFSFDFDAYCTIQFVKDQIEVKYEIPAEQQRLIFQGELLEDMKTLNAYNIQQGSILYLVLRL